MIAGCKIQRAKAFSPSHSVNQVINSRDLIFVLNSHFVQCTIVNARPQRTILFLNKHYRGGQYVGLLPASRRIVCPTSLSGGMPDGNSSTKTFAKHFLMASMTLSGISLGVEVVTETLLQTGALESAATAASSATRKARSPFFTTLHACFALNCGLHLRTTADLVS